MLGQSRDAFLPSLVKGGHAEKVTLEKRAEWNEQTWGSAFTAEGRRGEKALGREQELK